MKSYPAYPAPEPTWCFLALCVTAYYGIDAAPPDASYVPWAVSATWLYYPRYRFFKEREPDGRIGYSILVYDPNR